jgi:hypothetical protein
MACFLPPFSPVSSLSSRWSFPLALAALAFAWPLAVRAELPEHAPDPDDVLPPDYLSVTPPPLTPPSLVPEPVTPPSLEAAPVVIRRVRTPPPRSDLACLQLLDHARVPYRLVSRVRGVQTPVEVVGAIGGVRLLPRAGRAPVMDCQLARALVELAPVFRRAGVTGLSFSGAYDYRTRRNSSKLSAHAHGLAIDVHALHTRHGMLDVKRDFPRDGTRWAGHPETVADCLGRPARKAGRTLRALACRLKLDPVMRYVLSPDNDADHHDHLHLEAYAVQPSELLTARGRRTQQGRRTVRR